MSTALRVVISEQNRIMQDNTGYYTGIFRRGHPGRKIQEILCRTFLANCEIAEWGNFFISTQRSDA